MRLLLASLLVASACAGHATVVAEPAPPPPAPSPAPASAPPPPPIAAAPSPQAHPAYLHALTDLRHARALLERPAKPDVKWDESVAIREIDGAINEIKQAAIDDGKPLSDHPMIDAQLAHRDRLRQAEELLHKAAADIDQREDNGWAKGLRGRANGHIHIAENAVREAMADRAAGAPPPPVVSEPPPMQAHPAYLHALTDLRQARFLLEKPAKPEVKWDEGNAVREIDAAINEIKHASIDDGKPLEDHPPVDAKLHHRDRLRKAEELLHKAAADIDEKEDNGWAKGLRGRANGHIHNAEHEVHEAMEDRHHGH
ncbi:MAG: hypothetical protein ABJE66_06280 [Deltaproteobacteria bacterium]